MEQLIVTVKYDSKKVPFQANKKYGNDEETFLIETYKTEHDETIVSSIKSLQVIGEELRIPLYLNVKDAKEFIRTVLGVENVRIIEKNRLN